MGGVTASDGVFCAGVGGVGGGEEVVSSLQGVAGLAVFVRVLEVEGKDACKLLL